MGLAVVTWNVLHRIHAVNWNDEVIRTWSDEATRIAAIADFVAGCDADVVCLQEVSGDQLAALRDAEAGQLFATPYPRVPAYHRRTEPATLVDPVEFLVIVVRETGARLVTAEAFPTDAGKGFQRVELATGVTVVNTHVSYGDKRAAQLARILDDARAARGLTILCGDFNADRATCAALLGDAFVPAIPRAPTIPTRPRTEPTDKSQDIDHVFIRDGAPIATQVLDGGGRSDHNPVRVTVGTLST